MKQSTRKTTWFCPGCRKTSRELPPSGLCAHCGDRLAERGYCPVCENYWPLAVGTPCPKHEIELEPSEPETAGDDGSTALFTKWAEVGRYADALACQPPRIRLEGEGIPTQIDGERMGGISMYPVAIGGVTLRVPEEFAAEARIILSQTWSATAEALDIDDWDDFDADGEAPPRAVHAPPAPSSLQRVGEFARGVVIRSAMPWIMAVFVVLIFGLASVLMWLFRLIGLN